MIYTCQICEKEFKRRGKKIPKTCSYECRNESYKKIKQFKCEHCNKVHEGTARELTGKARFCSQDCTNEWKKIAYKGRKLDYILIECNFCSKSIERMPSKVNKRNYCNKSCRGKDIWKIKNLSQKMRWKPCLGIIQGKKMWFRSKWELVFAKDFLEKNNLKWKYESKSFALSDGSTYTPDFYVEDDNVWIEVKGYDKSNSTDRFFKFREDFPDENSIFANEYVLKNIYGLNLNNKYLNSLCAEDQAS